MFGGILGVGGAFVYTVLERAGEETDEQEKLAEIRKRLIPSRWRGKEELVQ
jgi:hypothetical protein